MKIQTPPARHRATALAASSARTALAVASALAAAGASAQQAAQLEQVVVTAQKTSTLALKTPLALSVVGGDELKAAGATDARRLTDMVPNVQISRGNSSSVEVSIRGIGSTNNTEVGDPAVGFSLDGVYLGRPQSAGAAFYDIERVEVLRGPQGTLYGRNATAGAINIITRKPEKEFEALIGVEAGNWGAQRYDGMLNLPVNDMIALRGVFTVGKHDGYVDTAHAPANNFSKDKDDQDNVSARLKARVEFGPRTLLNLSVDGSQDKGAGSSPVQYQVLLDHPTGSAGRYVPTSRYEGSIDNRAYGFSGELVQGLGAADLTVIAAHRDLQRKEVRSDATAAAGSYAFVHTQQDSVEARIASAGKQTLSWLAGLYYFEEKGSPIVLGAFAPSTLFYQDPMKTRSVAGFGQVTWAAADSLRLTGGLRITKDTKSRTGCNYPFATIAAGLPGYVNANNLPSSAPPADQLPACPTANVQNASVDYSKLTYKVGADYDLDKDVMLYTSLATGYKAGGFNDGNLATANNPAAIRYNPENLTSLEFGAKGRFLENRLELNAAAFFYSYSDLQVSTLTTCLTGAGTCTVTQNAAKATIRGLELEGKYALAAMSRLNFSLGALDSSYDSFITGNGTSFEGRRLDKSPKGTAMLGYTQGFKVAGGVLNASIAARYSSAYVLSNFALGQQYGQAGYHKTDVGLGYQTDNRTWSVQAYVRNLENRNTMGGFSTVNGSQPVAWLAEPRVFGVRAAYNF